MLSYLAILVALATSTRSARLGGEIETSDGISDLADVASMMEMTGGNASLVSNVECFQGNEGSIKFSLKVKGTAYDLVSLEMSAGGDLKSKHLISYVAAVKGGIASDTIFELKPGMNYSMSARLHTKKDGHEGVPGSWTDVGAISGVSCITGSGKVKSSKRLGKNKRSRWIEVYRVSAGKSYPDFLDDHNAATEDFYTGAANKVGQWGMSLSSNAVITRYCVNKLDDEFAQFGSCNGGKCSCRAKPDRYLLREKQSEIASKCQPTSLMDSVTAFAMGPGAGTITGFTDCKCTSKALGKTHTFVGKAPIHFPIVIYDPFSNASTVFRMNPEGLGKYPTNANTEYPSAWFSFPSGGRCKHGAKLGSDGCTWQRDPLSFSRMTKDFFDMGVKEPEKNEGSTLVIPEATSVQNIKVGRAAFQALNMPPCGA